MKLFFKVINLFVFYFQLRFGGLKFSIGFILKDKSKENVKGLFKVGNFVKLFELRGSRLLQTEFKIFILVKRELSFVKFIKLENIIGFKNSDFNICILVKSKDTKLFIFVK